MTDMSPGPDFDRPWAALLEDWVTIWQSELAGLATDREMHEAGQRAVDAWAVQARLAATLMAGALEPAGRTGPAAPAGAAAVAAAPDGRDAVIEQLLARIAELERRLGSA